MGMPLSKRDRKVDLTKTRKKPEKKQNQVNKIQKYIDEYEKIYIIEFLSPRNLKINEMRVSLPGQLVFGKNKVAAHGLSRCGVANLDEFSAHLKGQRALLFSNADYDSLRTFFDKFCSPEFSRSGNAAPQTVTIKAGPLRKFAHTMEPYMRQLGMPVKLVRGVVHLDSDYRVCKKKDVLTPEQCRILRLFDLQLSEFKTLLVAQLSKKTGLDVFDEDASKMDKPLPPAVEVTCELLDNDQYHFVATPCDALPSEDEGMGVDVDD